MRAMPHYEGIDGLRPRMPLGAALSVGIKGPSGAPTNTDRFYFVSPYDSAEGKFRVRPQLPQFAAWNEAEPAARRLVRGNLLHARREECFEYRLRAQVLTSKWPAHPQKLPACTGDGDRATRYYGDTPDDFREIACPNELCEFRQGSVKLCKPFAQLLFRPRWENGERFPSPLTKLTTGSWNSVSALAGFFKYIDDQARQFGLESYSLFGLPFSLQLTMRTKPQAQQRFPVLAISPDCDLIQFFAAQRRNISELGGDLKSLPAVALTDPEMQSAEVLASDAAMIAGEPISKPSNVGPVIEAEEVKPGTDALSREAVQRIKRAAQSKGMNREELERRIGGKLEDAPSGAEAEILAAILGAA